MGIDYRLSKLTITGFRGIDHFEFDFRKGFCNTLIGANNAGKSTVLNAIALVLSAGGSHQWTFSENDFFQNLDGSRVSEFLIVLKFSSSQELGYPAVKGVGDPVLIHGIQFRGFVQKGGRIATRRMLLDSDGKPVTVPTRTPIRKAEKDQWADHNIGYSAPYARLDDIYDHTPEVWYFKPQNIEASLYVWKTGPIQKLSKLLVQRFMSDSWTFEQRQMPKAMQDGHNFFRRVVEAFPFWKDTMKPKLESVFSRYVGSHALVDLRPDILSFEDWLSQQLSVSLATDPESVPMPLRSMGDGWQSVIRLAALEALTDYPDLVRERVVLLLEEPETHLHPHLRRKIRTVLTQLAEMGWTIVYTTHSSELISFDANQTITRMVRNAGKVRHQSVSTDEIEPDAKLQSKLDDNGAHDFLFGNAAIFCEGPVDSFAIKAGLDESGVDLDSRSISVTKCGSVTSIPAFAKIAAALGIRFCAVSDEDKQEDGIIKPQTVKARQQIHKHISEFDLQVQWSVKLESCLKIENGKATPEKCVQLLAQEDWQSEYPEYLASLRDIAFWIDPKCRI